MQNIAMEGNEYGGSIYSSKVKDDEYIADQENSDSIGTDNIDSNVENEEFSDGGNSSKSYTQFKIFLVFQTMDDVSLNALKLVEILQPGSIDKGEVSTEGKYKVCNERWF